MGRQLLAQWTTQYFSLYQDCHHIPAAYCLQHREQRISLIIPEIGNIIWSSNNSKWQECMRETDADRSWQAGHGNCEPENEMNKEDPTQSLPFGYNLEDLEAHVLAHSSERVNSDSQDEASKVETQKRKHSVHAYFRENLRDLFFVQKIWVTWQQQSTKSSMKNVNLGAITDTLSWYKFSPLNGIRVKPKLHRRRSRLYESSYSRRRSQKLVIRTIY